MSTEDDIEALLIEYKAARTSILTLGQSYTINTAGTTRTVAQANLPEIENAITSLEQQLKDITGESGMIVTPGW